MWFFFFFQAEDGIRDLTVTGVQTCALPISRRSRCRADRSRTRASARPRARRDDRPRVGHQNGRASCRGRGEISVVGGSLKKKTPANAIALGVRENRQLKGLLYGGTGNRGYN